MGPRFGTPVSLITQLLLRFGTIPIPRLLLLPLGLLFLISEFYELIQSVIVFNI